MTAREKFKVNDRVRLTAAYADRIPRSKVPQHPLGTVTGFARAPFVVRIRRDGLKSVESYHMRFWDVITEQERSPPTSFALAIASPRARRSEKTRPIGGRVAP